VDRCDECGFSYDDVANHELPARIRSLAPRYDERLRNTPVARLRAHPLPDTWSALEYACHVRDVLAVQRERIELMTREDDPEFTPMDRELRVTRDRYNEQDPMAVADDLARNADGLAHVFELLSEDELLRTAIYNYPVRALRSAAWVGCHTVHEGEHHLGDIDRVLAAVVD
jgi:hypothetical protein